MYVRKFDYADKELSELIAFRDRQMRNRARANQVTPEQALTVARNAEIAPWADPALVYATGMEQLPFWMEPVKDILRLNAERDADMLRLSGAIGKEVQPWEVSPGGPEGRMNAAMMAANAAGLLNDDGDLVEPKPAKTATVGIERSLANKREVFDWVTERLLAAGQPFRFVDKDGKRMVMQPNPSSVQAEGGFGRDSTDEPIVFDAAFGDPTEQFVPIRDAAGPAGPVSLEEIERRAAQGLPGYNPRLHALIDKAEEKGLVTDDGFLLSARGRDVGSTFLDLDNAFRDAGMALPFLTQDGPTILRTYGGKTSRQVVLPEGQFEGEAKELRDFAEQARAQLDQPETGGSPYPSVAGFLPGPVEDAFGDVLEPLSKAGDFAYDKIGQPTVRTAGMALTALPQELDSHVRTLVDFAQTGDYEFRGGFEETDLGIAAEEAIGGLTAGEVPDVDVGSGLTVDPESKVAEERRKREQRGQLIGGKPYTLGRAAADFVGYEPGTIPFQLVSGFTDTAKAIVADPTVIGLSRASKLVQARKVFSTADDVAEAGGLKGYRAFVEDRKSVV